MIDKVKKSECVLCGGCKNTCPADAIALEGEYLGFSYPEINNSLCIACNKCESACPVLQPRRNLLKVILPLI